MEIKAVRKILPQQALKVFPILFALALFFSSGAISQQNESLVKKPDSLSIQSDSLKNGRQNNKSKEVFEGVKLDAKTYFSLLAYNAKQDLILPFHTKGKDWAKVGGLALLTGAVAITNRPVSKFATKLHDENKAVASISKYVTRFGGAYEIYTLAGFYAYGLIFKTQKEKITTALATQAYILAGAVSFGTKYLASEQRPYYTDPFTNRQGPIFHGPFYMFKKGPDGKRLSAEDYASFPSGHTTAAFSAATVYAMEYRDKPLIPILSYSAATLVGLSRLTENKHWPADILVGAMLGYLSGRQVVKNYHRYFKIKHSEKRNTPPLSFNFQYENKQLLSNFVYRF